MYQHFMYSLKPSTQDVERPQYTSSCSGNQKVLFSNSSRSKNSGSGESAHNDIISEDTSSKPPVEPADMLEQGQQKAVVSGLPPGAQGLFLPQAAVHFRDVSFCLANSVNLDV